MRPATPESATRPSKVRQEILRKSFHMLTGGYLLLYALFPRNICLAVLGFLGVLIGSIEWVRLKVPRVHESFALYFGPLMRTGEKDKPTAILWGIAGAALVIGYFSNRAIVFSALGFLTFADAAAAICGRAWGKRPLPWNRQKTWEGGVGFTVFAFLWALLFLPWPLAFLGALLNAFLETLPIPGNDNFSIPVLAAVTLYLLSGVPFLQS